MFFFKIICFKIKHIKRGYPPTLSGSDWLKCTVLNSSFKIPTNGHLRHTVRWHSPQVAPAAQKCSKS